MILMQNIAARPIPDPDQSPTEYTRVDLGDRIGNKHPQSPMKEGDWSFP